MRFLNARLLMGLLSIAALSIAACGGSQIVPAEIEPQITRGIPFEAVKAAPERYKGQLFVLGGKILNARRLKNATEIEVLQLPLERWDMPRIELSNSTGRFLAYQAEFLDPATLPSGTVVSLVLEAVGSKKMPLDDEEYTYPTFSIRTLKVWPETAYTRPPPRPYFYRYPYHPFYPYWWDPWY